MTLSKRACRRYADPKLTFQQNNGLLHSGQIRYIVRTAIKNVGGKQILLLYIYLREHLEKGVYTPHWTMFQGKEDFITLATREDGNLSWRVSNFDNLEYGIEKKLAFIPLRIKSESPGTAAAIKTPMWSWIGFNAASRQKKSWYAAIKSRDLLLSA